MKSSVGYILLLSIAILVPGPAAEVRSPASIELVPAIDVTTWPDAPFRWRDIATNGYAPSYQDAYTYGDASITVTFDSEADSSFAGHLSATNLKPNFAYQMKLAGKPSGLWGPAGDDSTNERIGYAGRWWRVQPNPGNSNDADYEAHHDDPAYIYEGYLLFDFFLTDRFGNAEVDFATESSFHVLWWEHQRTPQACDSPVKWRTVTGEEGDDAYAMDLVPTDIGVYAEIERLCYGETRLPPGLYNCRFVLTEESFHQSGGPANPGWVSVSGNQFQLNGGAFHYAGTNCYYLMHYAANAGTRSYVDEVLEESKEMGLNVVRTWGFSDGGASALQTEPGVYNETVFQGLDYVLYKAGQLGLHVLLPFVNNWDDYGGMNQYVQWTQGAAPPADSFVTVNGTHFEVAGLPYYYAGANFWCGLNLGSAGPGGDRSRLERELDRFVSLGINNLRVMAGSEGPDTEPWRMVPSLQTSPAVYDSLVPDGLDYLLAEMKERELRAVMCLNNFWPWSGGMAQYVSWNGGGSIPYPPPEPGGDWNAYQDYASDFYSNAGAKEDFRDHISFIINHVNPYTGLAYKDDPTVMSWELGNEPRGFNNNATAFNQWIDDTAAYIKSLDSEHLVTTGCEGDTPWPSWNGLDFTANHNGPDIDYTTMHIWPQNWGWYDPSNPGGTYASAEANARSYFNTHETKASTLGKPMVLEEFGLARDGGSYDPASTTVWRDTFLAAMYDEVYASASSGGPACGDNFWAWGGEGRPLVPYGSYWNAGDPWIGDPPHEHQGWYSVYDIDSTTLSVLSSHAQNMASLVGAATGHDDFYTYPQCKQWYKDHISAVLNRVNTFNGITYKDDPTVFAWELANEPRCTSDVSGNTLQGWIEEMAAYIKSLDSQHMVTTGSEGFYGPSGPSHNPYGWFANQGVDFIPNHQPASIDFGCFHVWPDHWSLNYAQSMAWADDHIEDSESLLGKPVILEEFGKHRPLSTRDQFYQGWYDAFFTDAEAGKAAGGTNFWILYHDAYPDYDGFGVYYPADTSTVNIIMTEARRIRDLSQPVPNEGNWASAAVCDTLFFEITGEVLSPSVAQVSIVNVSLSHTDDYVKDGDEVTVAATVTSLDPMFGIDDIRADLQGLGGGASEPPDAFVDDVATWSVSSVACSPSDGIVTVTVTATDPILKATAHGYDQITADNTAPAAVSGLGGAPRHEAVALSWDDPTSLDTNYYGIMIRYAGSGDYPVYGSPGAYPTTPLGGDGQAFDGTGLQTSAMHTISGRDILYYTAFAYDWALNYGPAGGGGQDRSTNYWLGDVAGSFSPGSQDYDGLVDAKDINSLSAAYWSPSPLLSPHNECDVGPTDDHSGFGIPEPDDLVDFEDLMIFSLTYGEVSKGSAPPFAKLTGSQESGPHVLRLIAATEGPRDGCLGVTLGLGGNRDELKGASVILIYDPSTLDYVRTRLSPALEAAGERIFFCAAETGPGEIRLDLAVLGAGRTILGTGDVAHLEFHTANGGALSIHIEDAELRSAGNARLPWVAEDLSLRISASLPPATRLLGAWPNPFNPTTTVAYNICDPQHVVLQVYDAEGRLVRTLVDERRTPGFHSVIWDGRDCNGHEASSGVYWVRVRAGVYDSGCKIVLLK